jgi:hypothetical protein
MGRVRITYAWASAAPNQFRVKTRRDTLSMHQVIRKRLPNVSQNFDVLEPNIAFHSAVELKR